MDALSEALNSVSMTGALFLDAEFTAPWGVSVPQAQQLAAVLAPGAEHLVNFHFVLDGTMRVEDEHGIVLEAEPGDIVLIPYGDTHRLSSGKVDEFVDGAQALRMLNRNEITRFHLGGGGAGTRIVCGFFGCRRRAMRMFLSGLPPLLRIRVRDDAAGTWIENSIHHLISDAETARPGRAVMLARMAEALFIEGMRCYMESLPGDGTGWLAAAHDPVVGRVLALIHREPERHWSTAELAEASGASRTVMTERFTRLLGEAPISYLSRCRLQLAARLLETTEQPVVQLAGEVGYESEASFNRAFKREFGAPPARYRKQARAHAAPASI